MFLSVIVITIILKSRFLEIWMVKFRVDLNCVLLFLVLNLGYTLLCCNIGNFDRTLSVYLYIFKWRKYVKKVFRNSSLRFLFILSGVFRNEVV